MFSKSKEKNQKFLSVNLFYLILISVFYITILIYNTQLDHTSESYVSWFIILALYIVTLWVIFPFSRKKTDKSDLYNLKENELVVNEHQDLLYSTQNFLTTESKIILDKFNERFENLTKSNINLSKNLSESFKTFTENKISVSIYSNWDNGFISKRFQRINNVDFDPSSDIYLYDIDLINYHKFIINTEGLNKIEDLTGTKITFLAFNKIQIKSKNIVNIRTIQKIIAEEILNKSNNPIEAVNDLTKSKFIEKRKERIDYALEELKSNSLVYSIAQKHPEIVSRMYYFTSNRRRFIELTIHATKTAYQFSKLLKFNTEFAKKTKQIIFYKNLISFLISDYDNPEFVNDNFSDFIDDWIENNIEDVDIMIASRDLYNHETTTPSYQVKNFNNSLSAVCYISGVYHRSKLINNINDIMVKVFDSNNLKKYIYHEYEIDQIYVINGFYPFSIVIHEEIELPEDFMDKLNVFLIEEYSKQFRFLSVSLSNTLANNPGGIIQLEI
ncbi:hypothetical protein [Psychroserpens luteolus]|uniref:hypothetical protein n=1 Tax=Psychroserpens luteolus TaxID=2855840 RepID=UPI001E47293C|nr:hypothetical protein [Psychroserpens luteolus]MCD2260122.1 hypothetical protein [Psychroserpens luteolus]